MDESVYSTEKISTGLAVSLETDQSSTRQFTILIRYLGAFDSLQEIAVFPIVPLLNHFAVGTASKEEILRLTYMPEVLYIDLTRQMEYEQAVQAENRIATCFPMYDEQESVLRGNGILIGQTARHIHEPGIGDHVRAFQHLIAELFVQLLVSGGNDDLAALAGEAVVGGNSGITVAHGGRDVAGLDVLQGSVLSGSDHAVHQTHVHPLPFAGNGAGVDCGKDADGYMKSAQNITQRRTGTGRLSALGTGDGHHTAHGLSQNIIARAQVVGTVAAKAGDRRIDDAGIDLLQDIIAQSQLVHHAGAVVFHHNIRFFDKLLEDLLALRAFGLVTVTSEPSTLISISDGNTLLNVPFGPFTVT